MAKTSVPRLRRIRYKDGRSLTVLNTQKGLPDRVWCEAHIRSVLDAHGPDISGFAFVVWGKDAASTASMHCITPTIPSIYAPDFVRNRLLALKIEEWIE